MQKTKLDKEEQDILGSFERGEWKPVVNRRQEIARHMAHARSTLAKGRRVNIRISSKDLEELQAIAVEDGMPYQTLMASVLRRVNIRISSKDLEELQAIAVEDGMPYQTLMASVLHRFVSGRFVETSRRTRKSRLPRVPLGT